MAELAHEQDFAFQVGNGAAVVTEGVVENLTGYGFIVELDVGGEPDVADGAASEVSDEQEAPPEEVARLEIFCHISWIYVFPRDDAAPVLLTVLRKPFPYWFSLPSVGGQINRYTSEIVPK